VSNDLPRYNKDGARTDCILEKPFYTDFKILAKNKSVMLWLDIHFGRYIEAVDPRQCKA